MTTSGREQPVLLIHIGIVFCTAAVVIPSGPFTLAALLAVALLPDTLRVFKWEHQRHWRTLLSFALAAMLVIGTVHSNRLLSSIAPFVYVVTSVAIGALFVALSVRARIDLAMAGVAVAIGIVLGYEVQSLGLSESQAWIKSGPGLAIGLASFSIMSIRSRSRLAIAITSVILGGFFLSLDFRSEAAICVTAGLFSALVSGWRLRASGIVGAILALVILVIGSSQGYLWLAKNGHLSAEAEDRYKLQTSASTSLIYAARPELIVSRVAIARHPLVGRGGHPELESGEYGEVTWEFEHRKIYVGATNVERMLGNGPNAHSVLFSSWIIAGLSVPILWVSLWLLTVRRFIASARVSSRLLPVLSFGVAHVGWDLLFSPWTARYEVLIGLTIALAIVAASDSSTGEGLDGRSGALA